MELGQGLMQLFWSFIPLFIMCNAFELIMDRFDEFDFYMNSDWLRFPKKIRHVLPLILANTQNSITFSGYGDVSCNRDTCKRVIIY